MNINQLIKDILHNADLCKQQVLQELIQQSYFDTGMQQIIHVLKEYLEKNETNEILPILMIYHSLFKQSFIDLSLIDSNDLISHLNEVRKFWNKYEDNKAFSLTIVNYSHYLSLKTHFYSSVKQTNDCSFFISFPPSYYIDQISIITNVFALLDSLISTLQNVLKYSGDIKNEIIPLLVSDGLSLMKLSNWLVSRIYEYNGDQEFHVYCIERLKIVYYQFGLLFYHISHLPSNGSLKTVHQIEPFPTFSSDIQPKRVLTPIYDHSIVSKYKLEMKDWFDYHMIVTTDQINQIQQLNGILTRNIPYISPFNPFQQLQRTTASSQLTEITKSTVSFTKQLIQTIWSEITNLELMKKTLTDIEHSSGYSFNQHILSGKYALMIEEYIYILQSLKYIEERENSRLTKSRSDKSLRNERNQKRMNSEISSSQNVSDHINSNVIRCSESFHRLIDSLIKQKTDWNEVSDILKEINVYIHQIILYYNSNEMKMHYKQFVYLSKDLSTESYSDSILISKEHSSLPVCKSLPSQLHSEFLSDRKK